MAEPPHPGTTDPLTLEESAARVRSYLWVEERAFEVLGRWVPTVPEHRVKAVLAAQSRTHGWHAELWRQRLPAAAGLDPDRLVEPAGRRLGPFLDALAGPPGPGDTAERLAGAHQVLLAHKIAAYRAHLARASSVADGPTRRWLRIVVADEEHDRRAGEELLAGLLGAGAEAERAERAGRVAAHRARLEALLAAAGDITGLDLGIVRNGPRGEQEDGASPSN